MEIVSIHMEIAPYHSRCEVNDEFDSLSIRVPSPRNELKVLYLFLMLIAWTYSEVAAIGHVRDLLHSPNPFAGVDHPDPTRIRDGLIFMSIWLTLWTVGGLAIWCSFFWMLVGGQRLEVTKDTLCVSQSLAGIDFWKREFSSIHVEDLRVAPVCEVSPYSRQPFPGWEPGAIAFEYGARTVFIARGADEGEGKFILKVIADRFPKYLKSLPPLPRPIPSRPQYARIEKS